MEGHLREAVVYVGGDGRQRFHDSSGYGRPLEGAERDQWGTNGVALSRVEAAHLLYRGDLDAVREGDRRLDFRAFLTRVGTGEASTGFLVRFLVYADLRERGFYLSPAREDWPNADRSPGADFTVYPRGSGPWDETVEHRIRVVGERDPVPLGDLEGVLAVVDEESDVTYFEVDRPDVSGSTPVDLSTTLDGALLSDRAVVWHPPERLYQQLFFGRPLPGQDAGEAVQLSLLEAAYLAYRGDLSFDPQRSPAESVPDLPTEGSSDDRYRAAVARGRAVEGERFDRRLLTYATLRERAVVPKTGFKFGADFRTYADVDSVEDLGHSELLVRALPADATRSPRDLALDVRLAHGVRKTMVFGLVGEDVEWVSLARLTP